MMQAQSADVSVHSLRAFVMLLIIQNSNFAKASYPGNGVHQHADAILSAAKASDIAVQIAGENLIGALPYFKQATKLEPKNAQFHSNLGVTYMRIGVCVMKFHLF